MFGGHRIIGLVLGLIFLAEGLLFIVLSLLFDFHDLIIINLCVWCDVLGLMVIGLFQKLNESFFFKYKLYVWCLMLNC